MAAFVLLPTVAGALGVAANLALVRLHRAFLVAEGAGTGCRMIAVPVGPCGHDFPIASVSIGDDTPRTTILQPQLLPHNQPKRLFQPSPVSPAMPAVDENLEDITIPMVDSLNFTLNLE